MSVRARRREDVLIVNRSRTGPEDDFGSETWVDADPIPERWHFQPAQSEERQGPTVGEVEWIGWGPPDTALASLGRIRRPDGTDLEAVGPVRVWTNPRTLRRDYAVASFAEVT